MKTVYGEVGYKRTVYEKNNADGSKSFVYLLDETLELKNVGLISTNLAEKLAEGIKELSYRQCAAKVSEMTGQHISPMGVWKVIQALGEQVCEEEKEITRTHKEGHICGEKEVPVLFEEADGVFIKLQGKDRRKSHQKKAEIKVSIACDGWVKEGKNRYRLDEKIVTAGIETAKDFHAKREVFNLDETEISILNADGVPWLKRVKDKSTIYQMDPFHKYQAIKENISAGEARKAIRELLDAGQLDEMFEYITIYRDSLGDDKEIEKVLKKTKKATAIW